MSDLFHLAWCSPSPQGWGILHAIVRASSPSGDKWTEIRMTIRSQHGNLWPEACRHEKQSQASPELGRSWACLSTRERSTDRGLITLGSTRRNSRRLPDSLCSEVTVGLMLGKHLKHLVISPTFIRGMSLCLQPLDCYMSMAESFSHTSNLQFPYIWCNSPCNLIQFGIKIHISHMQAM